MRIDEGKFWGLIEKGGAGGCWPWAGSCNEKGYGLFRPVDGRLSPIRAHRLAWRLTFGPVPGGLVVMHLCDNPPCCNPDHLVLGTQAANVFDMQRKGRGLPLRLDARPHFSTDRLCAPNGKLTKDDVLAIRDAGPSVSHAELGRKYKVDRKTISRIRRGEAWLTLPEQRVHSARRDA